MDPVRQRFEFLQGLCYRIQHVDAEDTRAFLVEYFANSLGSRRFVSP